MSLSLATVRDLLVTTGKEVVEDDVPSLSAAIAYYTVFSLPPLLVVIVAIAGAVFGPDKVQEALMGQAKGLVGPEAAGAVRGMIENAGDMGSGIGAKLAGLAALLFGATGAFGQLQKALNRAWEVEEVEGGGIKAFIFKRILSFGLVLTIAFLLLVSLGVSAVLTAFGDAASAMAPSGLMQTLVQALNVIVSLGVITALFAALFKWLPDADISWRDVGVGAFVTALLFTLGKTLIGLYLGTADPGSAFGAAGSLALILVWIYYSSLIVLAGAEFTQVWAVSQGGGIEPDVPGSDEAAPADAPAATPAAKSSADVKPDAPPADPDAPNAHGFSIEDASAGRTR